jgi:hypothetical protein
MGHYAMSSKITQLRYYVRLDLHFNKSCRFSSHEPCYVSSGFCSLSRADKLAVLKTVGFAELLNPEALSQEVQTAAECLAMINAAGLPPAQL